jgi:hypothetical protein
MVIHISSNKSAPANLWVLLEYSAHQRGSLSCWNLCADAQLGIINARVTMMPNSSENV